MNFNRAFHYKPSILGPPVFLETPIFCLSVHGGKIGGDQDDQDAELIFNICFFLDGVWCKILILRKLQHTPGTYPGPLIPTVYGRKSLHYKICCKNFRDVSRVWWNFLRKIHHSWIIVLVKL